MRGDEGSCVFSDCGAESIQPDAKLISSRGQIGPNPNDALSEGGRGANGARACAVLGATLELDLIVG